MSEKRVPEPADVAAVTISAMTAAYADLQAKGLDGDWSELVPVMLIPLRVTVGLYEQGLATADAVREVAQQTLHTTNEVRAATLTMEQEALAALALADAAKQNGSN